MIPSASCVGRGRISDRGSAARYHDSDASSPADCCPANDPQTGRPVTQASARIELLVEELSKKRARIAIPSTVCAEFLAASEDSAQEFIEKLTDRANFEIVAFDFKAAVQASIDHKAAIRSGNKKADLQGSRQCVKADRQIVATAKTRRADVVYTGDDDVVKICASMGVQCIALWDLPAPESTTPLLDHAEHQHQEGDAEVPERPASATAAVTSPSAAPTETPQPSEQSAPVALEKAPPLAPGPPVAHQGDQAPPPPGPSHDDPPPTPSKQ